MNKRELPAFPKLVAAILVCEAAGGVGAFATRDAIDSWYSRLRKPAFNPPNWVFGPVWTVLYMLMGIALYRISTDGGKDSAIRRAQGLFAAQLALNVGWTFLFFGRRSPLYALVEMVLLWTTILFTIAAFFRISKVAGLLLVPYLLWTMFAAVLNLSIWRLND